MKNAGMTGALVLIGAGLFANAFMANTPTVQAVPAVAPLAVQGGVEPTIVWYGTENIMGNGFSESHAIYRAWSDGTVEVRLFGESLYGRDCSGGVPNCVTDWFVISSPTEGLNAAADITFDEVVDGADLSSLLSRWGDAPRNPMPPSDCPLGLLN